jgi:hypothetical protein
MNPYEVGNDMMQGGSPMRFENSEGESLELELVGYEFPDIIDSKYDSNWLRVKITAVSKDGSWTATDSSLLTWEVARLISWFEQLSRDAAPGQRIDFIEPCLSMELVQANGEPAIRIFFELALRPAWNPARVAGMEDVWLDFPLRQLDLGDARRSLEGQLARYPRRALEAR